MRQIKHEFDHKDRLNKEINADTKACSRFFKNFVFRFDFNPIEGFVQEHYCDPYGVLLLSQIQVIFLF